MSKRAVYSNSSTFLLTLKVLNRKYKMLWVSNSLYRGCKVTNSAFNMHEPRWGSRNNEKLNPGILKSIQLIYDKIVCKD